MLDRDSGKAAGEFGGDGLGRGHARLLYPQPADRLGLANLVLGGIVAGVGGERFGLLQRRRRSGGGEKCNQQEERPEHVPP